jgi:hypothetical protein
VIATIRKRAKERSKMENKDLEEEYSKEEGEENGNLTNAKIKENRAPS